MKKIYSFAFAMLSFAGLQAQSLNVAHADRKMEYQEFQGRNNGVASEERAPIWSDDFSNPDNWIIAHDGTFNSDFEIGTGLVSAGQYGTPAILSTTAANGYAMYNSDGFNNTVQPVTYEQAHITTATPINLSTYTNLVLSFETQYRRFTDEQTYLIVSTDGNFPTLDDPTMDISAMPGVYKVWEDGELTTSVSPGNPTTRTFNISEIAGGASQVWVRLQFTGIWGYAWYIDDISISEQFASDAKLFAPYASHVAGSGLEYARIPQLQVPAEMNVGCYVKNDGAEPLTNLSVNIWLGDFNYNQTQDELLPGDTMFVDGFITSPTAFGFHELYYGVTCDQSATDGNAANNEATRYYEMTVSDYSMDGLGVHPTGGVYSSLGTNSFTDNADELMLFTYYEILQAATVLNVNIQLANGTVAGGDILVQIHNGDDILVNDIIDNILGTSDMYTVTEADVAAGFITIPLTDALPLDAGGYCVSAMLFSNGNASDIRVLDDNTVPQPGGASLIYLPTDATIYSNGNAFAIRMGFDGTTNVQEAAAQLDGVNVFPNPSSNGIVNIVTNKGENLSVEVFDSVGALVDTKRFYMNTTLDVSSLAKGVYTVRVNSANASSTKMVTIQ